MTSPLANALPLPCGVSLPNRIFKSAMTEGLADRDDRATEGHNQLYKTWSEGGSGMLLTGNVMVDRRFLERPGNVVIDEKTLSDGGLDRLKAWAAAGTVNGNQMWMQISHPGRQVQRIVSNRPFAPSEVQLKVAGLFGKPRAMTEEDILDAIKRYAFVARTARDTGFTGVQLHAAHGYLISSFLSPVTNQRDDAWGGSIENRARLLMESLKAIRAEVGDDYPVAIKLNSADFQKGGFSLDDSAAVAAMLNDAQVDFLEISGGTYEQPKLIGVEGDTGTSDAPNTDASGEQMRESTRKREAYFLQYIPRIRAAFKGPIGVTGGFRDRAVMEAALADGNVDAIGLARPLCVEPDLPNRLISQTVDQLPTPENELRLGNGWLGPNSSNYTLKMLNNFATVFWFYRQIVLLAKGKVTNPDLGSWRALLTHQFNEYKLAFRRKG